MNLGHSPDCPRHQSALNSVTPQIRVRESLVRWRPTCGLPGKSQGSSHSKFEGGQFASQSRPPPCPLRSSGPQDPNRPPSCSPTDCPSARSPSASSAMKKPSIAGSTIPSFANASPRAKASCFAEVRQECLTIRREWLAIREHRIVAYRRRRRDIMKFLRKRWGNPAMGGVIGDPSGLFIGRERILRLGKKAYRRPWTSNSTVPSTRSSAQLKRRSRSRQANGKRI